MTCEFLKQSMLIQNSALLCSLQEPYSLGKQNESFSLHISTG